MQTKYNPFDERSLDTDRLLNDLYGMQASLSMLLAQLAQTPQQEWNQDLLNSLLCIYEAILRQSPSLLRH